MSSNSIFESFLAGQGYALFESLRKGEFAIIGTCPDWCPGLFDLQSRNAKRVRLADNSPFLENFLVDADNFWNSQSEGSLSSGNWIERDKSGHDIPLEAFALSLEKKKVLILRNLSAHFAERQQWFQTARDSLLAHERLLSEIQKKEILLHCIVHDLSQPLTAISGCFNLLRLENLPPPAGKYAEAGQRESQRQELMIRGILSAFSGDLLAQQSADKSGAPPPDLAACAQQAIEEFSSAFKDKGVALRFVPPPNASPDWRVAGDAPRLDRIFGNLLENTLRYSPANSTVTVGLEDHGESILAFVDDEGPGLPPDLPPTQLFALFSKGKSHSGKAGLGLYFCKITVERWRGAIGAETRAQGGSRFWFRLPRASANSVEQTTRDHHDDGATNVARPPAPRPSAPVKPLRILVVEDTEINRELVSDLLTRRGHSVVTAADGIEALAALEHNAFDAVLMDQEMPRMNGLDATRAIRKMETSTGNRLRVVGFTGNATEEDERRCLNAGMDAFIAKPVHMDKLYQAVESQAEASPQISEAQSQPDTSSPASNINPIAEDESAAALHRATGGNKKLQRSLIKTFLADAPKTISRIRSAIAEKDPQKLASSAHALRGSIAIFGAPKAVSIVRSLEAMGRSGHLFNAGLQFRALESEFARTKRELLAIFPAPKPKSKTARKAK